MMFPNLKTVQLTVLNFQEKIPSWRPPIPKRLKMQRYVRSVLSDSYTYVISPFFKTNSVTSICKSSGFISGGGVGGGTICPPLLNTLKETLKWISFMFGP